MEWKLKTIKIKDLKPLKKNPRQLTVEQQEQLKKSLSKFGICEFVVANSDNTIIGGHQRYKILKKLGHTEIPVLYPEKPLTDDEVDELNIRLNKNTGDWDWDILANEWSPADLIEWGFSLDSLDIDIDGIEETPPDLGPAQKNLTQMTFTLTLDQRETVDRALSMAKKKKIQNPENENSNGNALAYIAASFNDKT